MKLAMGETCSETVNVINRSSATKRDVYPRRQPKDRSPSPQVVKPVDYLLLGAAETSALLGGRDLKAAQWYDPLLRAAIEAKNDKRGPDNLKSFKTKAALDLINKWDNLFVDNELLIYRPPKDSCLTSAELVLIPSRLQVIYVRACHVESGHQSLDKTADRVCRRGYFYGWRGAVADECRSCRVCAECARGEPPKQGPMQTMEVGAPMQRVAIDLVGPFVRTPRMNQYILTAVEHFSRFLIAVPIRNKTAKAVAAALHRYVFTVWGLCREIYSDRGREFCNELMTKLCTDYGIKQLKTTARRPSANGRCERVHRGLNATLSKIVMSNQKDWDLVLAAAVAAYNASKHSSTGYSPNYLMTGREALSPLDLKFGTPLSAAESFYNAGEYADQLQGKLMEVYSAARKRSARMAALRKLRYDGQVKNVQFSEGQKVLLRREGGRVGLSTKLFRPYVGPYVIVRRLGPVNYVVIKPPKKLETVVHADRLRAYVEPPTADRGDGTKSDHQGSLCGDSSTSRRQPACTPVDSYDEPLRRSTRLRGKAKQGSTA